MDWLTLKVFGDPNHEYIGDPYAVLATPQIRNEWNSQRAAPEREIAILKARASGMTLKAIGLQWGITGGRVAQIEYKALRRLRHPARNKQIWR
jgi:DNA-directed RNA polymerase sigma subunit (sigma70/sigma32)